MKVFILVAIFIALCTSMAPLPGLQVPAGRHLVAQRTRVPLGFAPLARAGAAHPVRFRVHLVRHTSLADLEDELLAVSTPGSPRLGQHLSYKQVAELFRPRAGAAARVAQWLATGGARVRVALEMDALRVEAPAAAVEALFGVRVERVESLLDRDHPTHRAQPQTIFVGALTVPAELAGDVEFVSGLEALHHSTHGRSGQRAVAADGSPYEPRADSTVMTPAFLRQHYGVNYSPSNALTKQCIGSFGSFYNPQCLAAFVQQVDGGSYGHINKSIGYNCWGSAPDAACAPAQLEADLDVDYITSMSSGVETWVWQSEKSATDAKEWMLNWATQVNAQTGPNTEYPQVFSLSYGLPELWQCNMLINISRYCPSFGYDSVKYIQAVDAEFLKMGLRGWTVMVATGDDGAAGDTSNTAYGNNYVENQVNQLAFSIVSTELSLTCAVPVGGMGRGALCGLMDRVCPGVLEQYVSSKWPLQRGCSLDAVNVAGSGCTTALPAVSSNCTIAQFPTYTQQMNGYACEIAAYDYLKSYKDDGVDAALLPNYPGASPHITAVGATMLVGGDEVTCSSKNGALITSGGYFSPVHPLPTWQQKAVEGYLAHTSGLPPANVFSGKGRAAPDVAFLGHNFKIGAYAQGSCQLETGIDGTSASSPSFAGLVSLFNDARLNAGKGTLGFLNPRLYAMGADKFNDITEGSNRCRQVTQALSYTGGTCSNPAGFWVGCSEWGFPAAEGYDAATGLGSPKFGPMMSYLMAN